MNLAITIWQMLLIKQKQIHKNYLIISGLKIKKYLIYFIYLYLNK